MFILTYPAGKIRSHNTPDVFIYQHFKILAGAAFVTCVGIVTFVISFAEIEFAEAAIHTYVSASDADMPGYNVFTRRDGAIRHFWSGEMGGQMADPGQDPRGAPDIDPLWTILDTTPEGRGGDWYPKLAY